MIALELFIIPVLCGYVLGCVTGYNVAKESTPTHLPNED